MRKPARNQAKLNARSVHYPADRTGKRRVAGKKEMGGVAAGKEKSVGKKRRNWVKLTSESGGKTGPNTVIGLNRNRN